MPPLPSLKPYRVKAGRRTILARLLVPVFTVMLLQSLLYIGLLWQGGVVAHAEQNAYDILSERVAGRMQYIENEMLNKWSNVHETEYAVLHEIESALAEWGAEARDIARDAELNARLVERLVPELIYMLRKNMVTGAFLVLDGPGLKNDPEGVTRSGCYLRDLDPSNYSINNRDIMVERGMPDVHKRMGLTFDAYWKPTFEFPDADDPNARFFFAPLNAARAYDGSESALFGYWSGSFRLDPQDIGVISYSIPLMLDGGAVIGVLGVDITDSYLQTLLNSGEILPDRAGAYFLGITRDGVNYERAAADGPLMRTLLGSPAVLTLGGAAGGGTRAVEQVPAGRGGVLGCVQNLDLYSLNTPFTGEQWALIAVAPQNALLSFSRQIMALASLITAIALVMGLVCVFFASRMVTSPISTLVKDLEKSDPHEPVVLKKLGIKEIDELTGSIEVLSAAVAESSSKISKILSMTKASIGVFEYGDQDETVFCSSNLSGVLGWPPDIAQGDGYVERARFDRLMEALSGNLVDERDNVYKIEAQGAARWVQLTVRSENGKTLGAASDVTRDVLTKQQIEYERDYDLLTNLYNRRAFHQKLSELFTSGQDLQCAALIMWDLDNLKYVNDTYGHECGDRYIAALAECLNYFTNASGAISARRSGDEFYTFLYGFESIEEARAVIDAGWRNLKEQPFLLPGGVDYHIRVSAGIAWYKRDAETWQELLRYADYAMYNVKHTVKGSLNEFDKASYLSDASMLYGMEALGKLIDYSLVKFAFQPILSVERGEVFGYELLMRPQVSEFKTPLDVLRLASAQAKLYHIERITWFGAMAAFVQRVERGEIAPGQRAFINSIGNQILTGEDFARFSAEFAPYLDRIVIEMLESERGVDAYLKRKIALVGSWNAMIAIDDYGVGVGSESILVFLSPDLVKLDMSLVRDIDKDLGRQNLLTSLISYVKTRGIQVIAEGVETEEEMRVLVAFGVNYLQGYYVGRPSFEISPIADEVLMSVRAAYRARPAPDVGDL